MTTALDAKLAFHRKLTCAALGHANPDAFDEVLTEGYAEIDRLFTEVSHPEPVPSGLIGPQPWEDRLPPDPRPEFRVETWSGR